MSPSYNTVYKRTMYIFDLPIQKIYIFQIGFGEMDLMFKWKIRKLWILRFLFNYVWCLSVKVIGILILFYAVHKI